LNFRSIIGHENIKEHIEKSIERGTFSHAHIFSGEDGVGKSLVAKAAALKIIGKDKDRDYADIIEYRIPKNKKSIGVNEVRELIEEINKKPVEGDKKIIIIYEAHHMTQEAQNAFLKTVEEPPSGIFIMLLCDNLETILDTIKSRCQIYKFHRLSENDMMSFLKKEFPEFSKDELKPLMAFSDGIPGRGESFVKDSSLKNIRDITEEILININKKNKDQILKYEDSLVKYKVEWQEVLTWFLSYIRDVLVYKETGNDGLLINIDKLDGIKVLSESFSFNKLNGIIDIIKTTRQKLERNVNPGLVFDFMLLKMQEV
jgi:DNA polymerase III subunit delta'